jgi:hypothetical protein
MAMIYKAITRKRLTPLHPYQYTVERVILQSIAANRGLTFTVEIARQGGKNELSARLEHLLLVHNADESKNLVKCSPTFRPQAVISMTRLKDTLDDAGFSGEWVSEHGYIIRFGDARAIFLSADESSRVVGHTAHLLLEIDEAQDIGKEKYSKEFKPMGATTNVTTVLYGTAWDDSTLLEETKQVNLELERKDGIRRHFQYDWQEVAKYNPRYLTYVESEKQRLGENHPLFLTQYCLQPIRGGGGFLSALQRAQLQGNHSRRHSPESDKLYIAGIDLAGEAEELEGEQLTALNPRRDCTVVTVGEIVPPSTLLQKLPGVRVVEHYQWTGRRHAELYSQLVDLLKNVWHCRRVVVDATGIGQPVASFLRETLGKYVVPFNFTAPAKSELGFNLLTAINSGCLKMYAPDGSSEYQEFWYEMEKAKSYYRPSQTMNFFVDPSQGHDDFLMSLALLVEAANRFELRTARGR